MLAFSFLFQANVSETSGPILGLVGTLIAAMLGLLTTNWVWMRNELSKKLDENLLEQKRASEERVKLTKALYVLTLKVQHPEVDVKEMAKEGIQELEK